jgi:hypothetical protein
VSHADGLPCSNPVVSQCWRWRDARALCATGGVDLVAEQCDPGRGIVHAGRFELISPHRLGLIEDLRQERVAAGAVCRFRGRVDVVAAGTSGRRSRSASSPVAVAVAVAVVVVVGVGEVVSWALCSDEDPHPAKASTAHTRTMPIHLTARSLGSPRPVQLHRRACR